ncbi:putative membrane protein YdgA-like protein [Legionella beliardensis]|uniref:Putative membrane protein YdgA-like protein n=1 Tax=Legionella beliardensis TaxID=91822 RepID=A0A378I5M4_9GAMM|nr:YdgA family protein [Legionella beliardensis]STX30026.1 putative membrane protein YdgA-like protein [Legionella beliardensis]
MRKLVVLVVVLVILVLGGYYAMGAVTERTIKHNIATINRTNGVNAQVVKYDRGWFKSNALLHWLIQIPERQVKDANGQVQTVPAQNITLNMPLKIYHGPIIFANNTVRFGMGYGSTDILLPDQYQQQFNDYFTNGSTQPKLNLSMFVTYLNSSQIEVAVPNFKLITRQDQSEFDWMGLKGRVNVTSRADKINGDFNLNGMQFKKGNNTAVLSEVTSEYNLHNTELGLYLGNASVTLPSFIINSQGQRVFELDNFNMQTSSDIENGLFNSHLKSSLDKVITNGKTFGPGNIEMAIRNLDANALGRINQQANHIQQSTTDLEKQQALFAILPEIPKLFSRGAELEVSELSFVMPEGKIEGNLQISLPQGENNNPLALMQNVQGKGNLRVPIEIVKRVLNEANRQKLVAQQTAAAQQNANTTSTAAGQAGDANNQTAQPTTGAQATQPNDATTQTAAAPTGDTVQQATALTNTQLDSLVQSGMLNIDGNYYVIEVALQQGQLQVNGKPFNPAMLKF